MTEFLAMGGYGAFIWPAYGVTVLVLSFLVLDSVVGLKRRLAELKRQEGDEE